MEAKEGFVPEDSFAPSSPPFCIVYTLAVIITIVFFPVSLGVSVLHCIASVRITKVPVAPLEINIILYKKNIRN